jgi:hypothetical protein
LPYSHLVNRIAFLKKPPGDPLTLSALVLKELPFVFGMAKVTEFMILQKKAENLFSTLKKAESAEYAEAFF